ncbi:BTAD domain-containing putative transcriptional regulator [Nonomuraea aurantiaca]|uniref:BTAD domain-containing putative transcriptional regulator n=1 Tax=Nonomuraea aurantiaca TaxID=2878562 RepID=UPI001CD94D7B|nr:BTAD domain-containing putative transcriptional regulator [Nonomuraea aurantiaca]MCA2223030.1 winged helix-turn-helix domain-containing protein [Nonomuraea aurantiaca]
MRVEVLGPVKAYLDSGGPAEISGVRLRMLLSRLALEPGRPVSAETLIDDLWGEEAPAGAAAALHSLVARLRKALGGAATLELVAGGYRLPVRAEDVDACQFEELVTRGRRELVAGAHKEAAATLGAALGLWQGAALADVQEAPFADPVATRLHNLRHAAAEDRIQAELHLGRHAEVLADVESLAVGQPLSERLAGLRMRALAAAGRQSDALAVYAEIRGRLADELGVDPAPELQEIHLALLRGEMERPAAPAETAPNRLPAQLTSFVGREPELAQLGALLSGGRLVTIVGPGGSGKTRLSLEAVARDSAHARGRAWFVSLAGVSAADAGVSAADQIVDAVLGALNDRLYEGGEAAPLDRICELLDVGDALLLLDNCEHLVEAAAELVDQLLGRLPRLRILATSREPLAITGEALCHLGPLDVPRDSAAAAEAEAVRLFVDRASSVRPGFALDASTVEAVVEICWRLDGMPLALELAAAKLRSMSVEQIAGRLDDRFRLLSSGSRAALPRQRTLLAVVEWSWDLLDEQERALARRLAFFPAGADLPALEAVCADASLPAEEIVYVIGSLVEKSIVQESGDRYRMLETVRAYALGRLAESGDDLAVPYSAYFLALAERNEPLLRTREQLAAIAVFDAEYDNLMHGLRQAADPSRFVGALFWYWGISGRSAQFESYLQYGGALPEQARAAFGVVRASMEVDSAGAREFHPARPLMRMAQLAAASAGESDLDDALVSADPWVRASAHWARDFLLTEQGDLHSGAASRQEARRGFEEVGDRWGLVISLLPLARDHSLRGEYGPAIAALERAVALSSELGTEDHLYLSRARLARERRRSGDLDGALRDIQATHRRARELGHRRMEVNILVGLANVHRLSGDLERADRILDELAAAHGESARDLFVSTRLENRLARGDALQARKLLVEAVDSLLTQGYSAGLAWAAELLAGVLALEGDPRGAAAALGMSQVIRGEFDHGEPELRALVDRLTERLGEEGYAQAYRLGAEMPRQEAIDRVAGLVPAGQEAFLR